MRTLLVVVLGVAASCGSNGPVDPIWSSSVSQLVLHSLGVNSMLPHPTVECLTESSEFMLVVADPSLSAWSCTAGPSPPFPTIYATASRTLSEAELDALVPTLEALRVAEQDCRGRRPAVVTLTVTTPSSTVEYLDARFCQQNDDRPKIEGQALDALGKALRQLAFPQP